jgi:hypothetical protein
MRIQKLTLFLAGATLLGLAPLTQAQDYKKAKKKANGYEKVALSAEEEAEVIANFERALNAQLPAFEGECKGKACAEGCTEECQAATAKWQKKVSANPTAYYAKSFAKRPASWDVLAPLVEEQFVAQGTSEKQRAIMLELVLYAPYETGSKLGSKLYEANSEAFGQDHVLAFALRGGKSFEKALYAQAEASNKGEGCCADIRPAAFFAFHGDGVGKYALVRAAKTANVHFEHGSMTQPMIAAMALERLGKQGLVDELLVQAKDAALAALDGGEMKLATRLALQAEYFQKFSRSEEGQGKWVELAWMDEKVAEHCSDKAPEVADADDVFRLIESVSGM